MPATIYFYLVLFQPQHTVAFALMLATIYCKKTTAIEMSTYCRLLAANCSRNVSYLSKRWVRQPVHYKAAAQSTYKNTRRSKSTKLSAAGWHSHKMLRWTPLHLHLQSYHHHCQMFSTSYLQMIIVIIIIIITIKQLSESNRNRSCKNALLPPLHPQSSSCHRHQTTACRM